MDIKCGTDIIEINRIKDGIEKHGDNFINSIYTNKEIEYCESKKTQKYQHYAVRFAAKEAVFKAISGYIENKYDINWRDIEITNDNNLRPSVNLKIKIDKIHNIDISLSHCKEYAIANCVVLFD